MDKEIKELLSMAIKLELAKKLAKEGDKSIPRPRELKEITGKWEDACKRAFVPSEDVNFVIDVFKDTMDFSFVIGVLEAVDLVLNTQDEILRDIHKELES